jgi:hypothetical protein
MALFVAIMPQRKLARHAGNYRVSASGLGPALPR